LGVKLGIMRTSQLRPGVRTCAAIPISAE
jgi:hypothetical protein